MVNQSFIQSIQQVFNKEYISAMVHRLQKAGHSDSNPFNNKVDLGLTMTDYTMRDIMVTVQTKKPTHVLAEYHVWIRPLSKEVYLGVSGDFKHIDEVYSVINGSGFYPVAALPDDSNSW